MRRARRRENRTGAMAGRPGTGRRDDTGRLAPADGFRATVTGMEIWINPACSKCRSALTLLDAEGADYTVRRYLEDVPSEDEIRAVLERLGLEPWDITRAQEADAAELGMKDWARNEASRERWVKALAEHPKLIQRPIITADDGTAVIGRTDDAVRDALSR
jgi:arsenate reductase (glutaredoxin)